MDIAAMQSTRPQLKHLTKLILSCVAVVLVGACGNTTREAFPAVTTPTPVPCPTGSEGTQIGVVADESLDEISGMVVSRMNPGVIWVHNDSGDGARLYAIDTSGALVATFDLARISAFDIEDIAIGPGPDDGVSYIYLADIGDNVGKRTSVSIYRFREPNVDAGDTQTIKGVDELTASYPGPPRNAETLVVDPETGTPYVVTKADGDMSDIYEFRGPVMELVATIDPASGRSLANPAMTGGDAAPDGQSIILRTYGRAFLYRRPAGAPFVETFNSEPCSLPIALEPQGEAITFGPDADSYLTVSEFPNPPIYEYELRQ